MLFDLRINRLVSVVVVTTGKNVTADKFCQAAKIDLLEFPVANERDVVILLLVVDAISPFESQVNAFGDDDSVPLKVPSPPRLYAVVPVPAFCDERRGQQTILLQRPRSFMPVTKREICCFASVLLTPAVLKNADASVS